MAGFLIRFRRGGGRGNAKNRICNAKKLNQIVIIIDRAFLRGSRKTTRLTSRERVII